MNFPDMSPLATAAFIMSFVYKFTGGAIVTLAGIGLAVTASAQRKVGWGRAIFLSTLCLLPIAYIAIVDHLASRTGFLFALDDSTASELWIFPILAVGVLALLCGPLLAAWVNVSDIDKR